MPLISPQRQRMALVALVMFHILIIIASGVWVSMASRKPTATLESD